MGEKETHDTVQKPGRSKNSHKLVYILLLMVITVLVFHQMKLVSKQMAEELKSKREKAILDSIKDANYVENDPIKYVQDTGNEEFQKFNKKIKDIIASIWGNESSLDKATYDEMGQYYQNGINDPNFQLLRRKFDEYFSGKLIPGDQIDQFAIDSMDIYDKEYFKSKFSLLFIDDAIHGGKWLRIAFINRPDKVFFVWVLNNRIEAFGDDMWDKELIKELQNDRQVLNYHYGF